MGYESDCDVDGLEITSGSSSGGTPTKSERAWAMEHAVEQAGTGCGPSDISPRTTHPSEIGGTPSAELG